MRWICWPDRKEETVKKILILFLHAVVNLGMGIGMGFFVISASMAHDWRYLLGAAACLAISTASGCMVGSALERMKNN